MSWLKTKNNQLINLKDIPHISFAELRAGIIEQCKNNSRPIAFFAEKNNIYTVLANDEKQELLVACADKVKSYQALTPDLPAMQMLERELSEDCGITPERHPWLKPLRLDEKEYQFFTMEGEEIHEVAVGPVHAGIIEPGHFRFMCHGEKVYHLEIQFGYQHRGIEKLFLTGNPCLKHNLAEAIAGDTLIGHSLAYVQAVESLTDCAVPEKAQIIRAIALELERVAIHIGDLAALSGDIAYQMGNAVFGATRTLVINSLLSICGSRYGKGLIRCGGVVFDIAPQLAVELKKTIKKVIYDVNLMSEKMFASPDVLSRFENTGVVNTEQARKIGLVGPAARASGLAQDIRYDQPFGIYPLENFEKIVLGKGDVYSRAYIRYLDCSQSLNMLLELLNKLPKSNDLINSPKNLAKDSMAVSLTEGWRGEIVHVAITDETGNFQKYKIKDPSFNNWFGLALSVRNNGISDFPLCNKSFNLSYCGHDL